MTAGEIHSIAMAAKVLPVEGWNPLHCGDSRMRIAHDGSWFHDGAPIRRPELVRLFASLLRKDAEGFVLVTPAEKLSIQVDDVPFMAVTMDVEGADQDQRLHFSTNVGDAVLLGPGHGLRLQDAPYLHVRRGLEAKLARGVWYRLAELAVVRGDAMGVWSHGEFFALDAGA